MAKRKRFKASDCAKLKAKFKDAAKLKKTKVFDNYAGIKVEKKAGIQHKTVDGVTTIKQPMRGKEKQYRTSKPLI